MLALSLPGTVAVPCKQPLNLHLALCRIAMLRKLGILSPSPPPLAEAADAEHAVHAVHAVHAEPSSRTCQLEMEQSEGAVSMACSPSLEAPWPTPLQLNYSLAAFGREQSQENARILASR